MILLIAILSVATALTAVWLALMGMVARDDWISAAYNKVLDNLAAIDKLRLKDRAKQEKMADYRGISAVVMNMLSGGDSKKKIAALEKQNAQLQRGRLKALSIFIMPGYVLQRKFGSINRGSLHKTILTRNFELYGRKHAENKTRQLLAKLLSYPIIGVAVTLTLGAVALGFGKDTAGLAILGVGTVIVLVVAYAMYDELSDLAKKRREAIARQFPNVVSKLALLVTSGMIMDKAWKETAYSQDFVLYKEMQTTSQELDNLVSPEAAYGAFIDRCNTKETAKLASAIMQNLSKGNAEIGALLKGLAAEAWMERRQLAKRDSERANSKLMIPTMLLFIMILIILMVPIAMNFSGI